MRPRSNPRLVPAQALSHEELIESFEKLTLDPTTFRHAEHVRLAWAYLARFDLFDGLGRYRSGLKALAAHHGAPRKYHETVTCGMMVLVHERVLTRPGDGSWESFVQENPDLLRWLDGAFFENYPKSVLRSDLARSTFDLPHSEAIIPDDEAEAMDAPAAVPGAAAGVRGASAGASE